MKKNKKCWLITALLFVVIIIQFIQNNNPKEDNAEIVKNRYRAISIPSPSLQVYDMEKDEYHMVRIGKLDSLIEAIELNEY